MSLQKRKTQKKNIKRQRFFLNYIFFQKLKISFLLFIFIGLFGFLLFHNFFLFLEFKESKARNDNITREINEKQDVRKNLEDNIDFLDTEIGVQGAVLEQNFLKREGEKVVEIIDF